MLDATIIGHAPARRSRPTHTAAVLTRVAAYDVSRTATIAIGVALVRASLEARYGTENL